MSNSPLHSQPGYRLRYSGNVQGVGFRPHIWREASKLGLSGEVYNTSEGVEVLLRASADQLDTLLTRVRSGLPDQARIERCEVECMDPLVLPAGFHIQSSSELGGAARVSPELAMCDHCRQELNTPGDRRFRYPFISCTHCGPRFSVVRATPYDRERTTFDAFPMCPACRAEYESPEDRRFHAQAISCPDCGPRLWLEGAQGPVVTEDIFEHLSERLAAGALVALKGWGGFHLCCDARNAEAIDRLRQLKQRPAKPLAVMMPDLEVAEQYVRMTPAHQRTLSSSQAPILLCERKPCAAPELPSSLAPDTDELGSLLPCTPIHELLMQAFAGPLVMTSGNLSGSPQCIDNRAARDLLALGADYILLHDLEIHNRVDDAVVRIHPVTDRVQVIRPGRGIAPVHLPSPEGFVATGGLLGLGGDLKNTLCLSTSGGWVLSPQVGDLAELDTLEAHQALQQRLSRLYRQPVEQRVADRHPAYHSVQQAQQQDLPLYQVQHHHAHLTACLVDNHYPLDGPPVLALCLDGTGYGDDETLWGAECLLGDYHSVKRLAWLTPFHLPGGAQAIREPWRVLVSQLYQAEIDPAMQTERFQALAGKPVAPLLKMIQQGVNAPLTSSMGRLFDAVAAALGCYPDSISYEGQAAIKLEHLARQCAEPLSGYSMRWSDGPEGLQLDTAPLWHAINNDMAAGRCVQEMAAAFHTGIAESLLTMISRLRQRHTFTTVVLTGGCFQNRWLLAALCEGIERQGLTPLSHHLVPCNDAGLSVGQIAVAQARLQSKGR